MSREEMDRLPEPQEKPVRARAPFIASPVASLLLAAACAPSHEVQAADVPNLPTTNAPMEQKQGVSSLDQLQKKQGFKVTGVVSQTEVVDNMVLQEDPLLEPAPVPDEAVNQQPSTEGPPEAEGGEGENPPAEVVGEWPEQRGDGSIWLVRKMSNGTVNEELVQAAPEQPAGEPAVVELEPPSEPAPPEAVAPVDTSVLEWLRATNVGTLKLDNWGLNPGQGSYNAEQKAIYNGEKTAARHYTRELGKTIRRIGDPELARMYAHIVQGNEDGSIRFTLIPSFEAKNPEEWFTPFGWGIGVNSGQPFVNINGSQIGLERFAPDKYDGILDFSVAEGVISTFQARAEAGEDIRITRPKRALVDDAVNAVWLAVQNFERLKPRLQRLGILWSPEVDELSRFFQANQNNPRALRERVNKDWAINATPQELR